VADTVDFQFDLFSSAPAPGSVLSSGRRSSGAGLGTVEGSTLSGVVGYCVDWVQPPAHTDFHDYNIQLQFRSYTSAATGLLLEGACRLGGWSGDAAFAVGPHGDALVACRSGGVRRGGGGCGYGSNFGQSAC